MSGYSALEIASALLDTGDVTDALATLDAAIAAAPDDDLLRLRAGILARLPGRGADALADLERIATPTLDDRRLCVRLWREREGDDRIRALVHAFQLWEESGDPRDAESLLHQLLHPFNDSHLLNARAVLKKLPNTWNWAIWRGDFEAAYGLYDQARATYQFALDHIDAPPDDPLRAYLRDRLANLPSP